MQYILGLAVFLGVHLFPLQRKAKASVVAKLGELGYKGVFSLISLLGLYLIVTGWTAFPNQYFYEPSPGFKHLNFLFMLPAVYFLTAAYVPNNVRRKVRHPMLTGIKIWALGHVLVNGDLRSLILFLSFLAYAVVDMIINNRLDKWQPKPKVGILWDIATVAVALVVYATIAKYHGVLFGVSILPNT